MTPVHTVNEYKSDKSQSVSSLFCIMAGDIPISVKIAKKLIITVAIATIPKSSGESKRDRTAVTAREIRIPEYLAIAVYRTPDKSVFFVDCILLGR